MADEKAFPPMSPADVAELTDDQTDKQNALKQEGVELLEDGKVEEALAKFSDAIKIGCASALLYSRRAGVLNQLGRTKAVINDCTAALAVNPDSAKAYKMRARANVKLELWEQANLDFQTGLKLDFDDQTEEESLEAAKKAKAIKEKAVKERVSKEQDAYHTKLEEDKKAYEAAVKARDAVWTDAKEAKYQETCKKAEQEKTKKEWAKKCADEEKADKAKAAAAAAQTAPKKEEGPPTMEEPASAKVAAEETNNAAAEETKPSGGYSSAADAAPPVAPAGSEATDVD